MIIGLPFPGEGAGAPDPDRELLAQLRRGTAPFETKLALAEGVYPLDPGVLLRVLHFLSYDADERIREAARRTIGDLPMQALTTVINDPRTPPDFLHLLAQVKRSPEDRITLVGAPNITPKTILYMMEDDADPRLLDRIGANHAMLMKAPRIIDALLAHPRSRLLLKAQMAEFKREFSGRLREAAAQEALAAQRPPAQAARTSTAGAPATPAAQTPAGAVASAPPASAPASAPRAEVRSQPAAAPVSAADDLLHDDDEIDVLDSDFLDVAGEGAPFEYDDEEEGEYGDLDDEDEEVTDLRQKLARLSVAERMLVAKMGSKQERSILVRDGNKKVALAAIQSPKLTEFEVEQVANLRSVCEDVLREIANHREWSKSYSIISALVRNPKTPTGISLRMLSRIRDHDLKDLAKDREIPYGVRAAAQRLVELRQMRKGKAKKGH